jgi:hypothetical protein
MRLLGSDVPFPTGFWNLDVNYGQMAIIHSEKSPSGILKVKVIGHNGSDGTYAWAWPELDLIILYFTQSRGSTSGIKLESKIDELLIHPEVKEINDRARVRFAPYLGSYTANFGIFRNTEFIVTVQNGCLALDIPNQFVFELEEPDGEGKWYSKLIDEIAVSFDLDDNGNVTSMKLHEAGYTFELPKGQSQEEEYPEDLDRYLGFYQTEDPEIAMEVIIKNGKLALDVPGQTSYELYPPDDEGKWYFRVNPTVAISFNESDDGRILSITIHLPDGSTYLRTRMDDDDN